MRIPRDAIFDEQVARFALRFCCEDCVFFHEDSQGCVHDFFNDEYCRVYYDESGEWIVFCKDFELC